MVHFDRLKPCTNGVIQADNHNWLYIQDHVPQLNTAAVNLPLSIGTNLELLDDDSDQLIVDEAVKAEVTSYKGEANHIVLLSTVYHSSHHTESCM